jgi:predicted alpha/beta superfamily hydrolase
MIILLLLAIAPGISGYSQLPKVSSGRLIRHEAFSSKKVANRNVDVWVPDGYSRQKKYAVLYMQDGQMLFDSTSNWNKKEWQADETLGKLISENKIRDCIVVGIWNMGEGRHADYLPQRPFEGLPKSARDSMYISSRKLGGSVFNGQKVRSDFYLKFIVSELKPFIDREYSTLPDRANTFIGGSSMGGLISLYAICEYPSVFGGAICMSTHWPGIFQLENNPFPAAMVKYLKAKLPSPREHKIYFDHGDQTLDAWYAPFQRQVDQLMKQKKYSPGKNWITKFFPGEEHSENAWARRLNLPILFMLGK